VALRSRSGREDAIDTLTTDAKAVLMAGYICISVDGRIVEKDDPFAQNNIFHSNCRGT
jgi:hypothetical protein